MPKPNMYQSLHTTVFGIDGYSFEIQIRTHEMDEIAENGIASHWAYKENKGSNVQAEFKSSTEQKLQFFKSVMDLSKDKLSNEEFVDSIQNELLNNNIYVFTPKGDVIEMPKGATPIDFAYRIHTKVGETMVGAIVNNNIVPLNYELKDGDIIKINTNKSSTPSKEWINMAKCAQTKNKIKSFFTKNDREIYIERGKYTLEKELRRKKLSFGEFFTDENILKICDTIRASDLDDIYLLVGNGRVTVNSVINTIIKEEDAIPIKQIKVSASSINADIIVNGIDKVKVNLANCCNPVYGDEIVGYITKGNGISVHKLNCHNLSILDNRTVEVLWNDNSNKKYLTHIFVYSNTSKNKMLDLMQIISALNVSVDGIKTMNKTGNIIYEIACYVKDIEQLEKVVNVISKNDFADKVERAMR